uniref:AMP-dependent synthetase/ligase domain-containing protein n=1 Tax=Chromera velia CCMP2878 TaxID=1169474 RepID=A0A0G4I2U5_9ALVE|eukprot:Cvel_10503.t1-p1 / transcript=Cvel_10503.t1 / gene=Cvel_10503 / organism=Chromera_velia_CCMP2878 / gene_product=Long-chain fatty acid transport protein 4, putative / transcript_product=Long-chain fatty acid transport protein 4, putative / location=Cvel_scaffold635:10914-25015(+) / protein_length=887 / sequence_SO=supercontig / SO=protein_coding / is_pseudo=false
MYYLIFLTCLVCLLSSTRHQVFLRSARAQLKDCNFLLRRNEAALKRKKSKHLWLKRLLRLAKRRRGSRTDAAPSSPSVAETETGREDPLEGLSMELDEVEAHWWHGHMHDRQVMEELGREGISNVADYFEDAVDDCPDNLALISVETGERLSYRELDERANRVAHWAAKAGVRKGDVVALLMENRLEFIWIWLGFAKVGAVIALLNTSVEGELLQHAVGISLAKLAVVSEEHLEKWRAMMHHHPPAQVDEQGFLDTYVLSSNADVRLQKHEEFLLPLLEDEQVTRPDRSIREGFGGTDAHFYIYTSGTTGKSKAAIFNHKRFIGAGVTWTRHMDLESRDVYYQTLPLYHGNGGVVAVSSCFRCRCPMVLRKKFSASNFFPDIRKHRCTATIYVGELWRYLCVRPEQSDDQLHTLRVACGNGLRPETWRQVVGRFGVRKLVEHYGQTEMPAAHPMINSYMRVGSCGYIPTEVRGRLGTEKLIEYDVEFDEQRRKDDGLCVEATPDSDGNTVGEAVVKLEEHYCGYTNKEATDRVVLRDVMERGDLWYHSGDLLRVDKFGFFFFVDRAGDTYRWKGQNVSTNDVCEILGESPLVAEANVYGVSIPNLDTSEKVGMASLVLRDQSAFFEDSTEGLRERSHILDGIHEHCERTLPNYARPYFIRVRSTENEKTGTLKFQKFRYVKDGFDPSLVSPSGDLLFFDDPRTGGYEEVTAEMYTDIVEGRTSKYAQLNKVLTGLLECVDESDTPALHDRTGSSTVRLQKDLREIEMGTEGHREGCSEGEGGPVHQTEGPDIVEVAGPGTVQIELLAQGLDLSPKVFDHLGEEVLTRLWALWRATEDEPWNAGALSDLGWALYEMFTPFSWHGFRSGWYLKGKVLGGLKRSRKHWKF